MSGLITTGNFPKALWPGINKWAQTSYNEFENGAEWKQIFEIENSTKNYEQDMGFVGMGRAVQKLEGEPIQFDTMKQGYATTYQHIPYGLGFIITHEEMVDCLYPKLAQGRTKALAFSFHQARELNGADVLNFAFNASYPGGDEVSLINSAHPTEGGAISNTLDVASDLSENALEQIWIKIADFRDNRNNRIHVQSRKLVVPKELAFTATRILRNPERPDTADRDINALYDMNILPEGSVVNHYLVDPKAWFVLSNCPDGLKCMNRESYQIANDDAFDTFNYKFRGYERYSFGWTDFRGAAGSPGA